MNEYPHKYPLPPMQVVVLSALSLIGSIALWLAAFVAFKQVADPWQAGFAATLIEACIIAEALSATKKLSWFNGGGLLVSITVSIIYNVSQAASITPALDVPVQVALSVGPAVAYLLVSLQLGRAIVEYQAATVDHAAKKALWAGRRASEAEADKREAVEYERKLEADALVRKNKLEVDELKRKRAKESRVEKAEEARKVVAAVATEHPAVATEHPAIAGNMPSWMEVWPTDIEHFRQLVTDGKININKITGSMLAPHINRCDKTARNWLKEARNGSSKERNS